MKLPNGKQAIVENDKLVGYVLNPDHPVGRHHAYLFQQLLGITRENASILKTAILAAAADGEVDRTTDNPWGTKYRLVSSVTGPVGTKDIVSVWILEADSSSPRLLTCFVE